MKIVIITGSYPPDICGVSDYTEILEQHLRSKGVDVEIYTGKKWGVRHALGNSAELIKTKADITHMQYPSTGYGWALGPQLISIAHPVILTLHEASQGHFLRQLSLYPFSIRAKKIIFTNTYERAYVQNFAPWIRNRSCLIPIGSNVPIVHTNARDVDSITYFGLLRPEKGIEEVLELGRLIQSTSQRWKIRIIGRLMSGFENYYEHLRSKAKDLPIDWQLGLTGDALSLAIASSDIAYLPFPDGASERRSSLIALLSNGTAVITTKGRHTPPAMTDSVLFANSPRETLQLLTSTALDLPQRKLLQEKARAYAKRFEWGEIALQHITVYEDILRRQHR